jgi:hypothetical protein
MIAGQEIIEGLFRIVLSHLRRETRAPKMGHPFFVLLLRKSRYFPFLFVALRVRVRMTALEVDWAFVSG